MYRRLRYLKIIPPKTRYNERKALVNPSLMRLYQLNPHSLRLDFSLLQLVTWLHKDNKFFGSCYKHKEHFMKDNNRSWEFVEIRLDTADSPKLEKFLEAFGSDVLKIIDEVLAHGYKLSVSWIDRQNSYVVSVSGTERSKYNNGKTLTSWSDSLEECFVMAGFKVLELTKAGDWKDFETTRSAWG